ncbi:MAG: patatin-like phospholipase family protein [Motiliproteus sp.]|nr:patatin-like phospholipase family protein [Motiliproteus sp.]MCW9051722.1 patatin-like phospholipase family protein [Motiliproteus sp.]
MSVQHLNLALQGGGAHGAFTWGVLDRLLEESAISFEAVSGTSAGAMNALMLTQGWLLDKHQGAQSKLAEFWHRVAEKSLTQWIEPTSSELGNRLNHAMGQTLLQVCNQASPYNLNPLDINPLRRLISDMVDFEQIRRESPFKLFIAATSVRSGKIKLFREWELDEARMLASACLPTIHQAIEVDGEFYWDGGYSGNPAIYPLVHECDNRDILIVMLQPLERDQLPTSAHSIAERISEFGFNSTFLREMRAIAHGRQLEGRRRWFQGGVERRLKSLNFHLIESDKTMAQLPRASKYNTRLDFLLNLKALGRSHTERWLQDNAMRVGRESTLDMELFYA